MTGLPCRLPAAQHSTLIAYRRSGEFDRQSSGPNANIDRMRIIGADLLSRGCASASCGDGDPTPAQPRDLSAPSAAEHLTLPAHEPV
jgi:hypothetical protein